MHDFTAIRTDSEIGRLADRERSRRRASAAADAALIACYIVALALLAPFIRAHVTSSPAFAELVAITARN
ncbi:MAG TPA: hypothetical protein VIG97_11550 [Luteimonas sp.]